MASVGINVQELDSQRWFSRCDLFGFVTARQAAVCLLSVDKLA